MMTGANQMDAGVQAKIKLKLKEFLRRDYHQDVERLNAQLGKAGDAGFATEMPPLPFAGDPFSLQRGNCIAVVGINPKWHGWESKFSPVNREQKTYIDSFIAGDEEAFNKFLSSRASEFEEGPYYGNYYTKLGNHLFREWFQGKVSSRQEGPEAAKEVFRRYVLKTDLLPWFSENTNKIDAEKLRSSQDCALLAYYEILRLLFSGLRPKWIQFNGSQMLDLIEAATETGLKRIQINERMYIRVGRSKKFETPILVHGFVNSQGGPQSAQQFKLVAQAFRDWVGNNTCFEF
jgi:hypothetical protein